MNREWIRILDERRVRNLFLWVLIGTFLSGCATTQETAGLQQSIGILNERIQTLDRRLEVVENQGKKNADLYARMDELQMRVGALNGRVDEMDHKVEQTGRAPVMAPPPPGPGTLSGPSITLPPAATAAPAPVPAPAPATHQPAAPPAQPQVASVPPPIKASAPPAPPVSVPEKENLEKNQYDKASQLFQQGQFEPARKEFQSFVSKYPKSELADDALFSLGECYLSEKKYQDAIEGYQQLLDRYPNGNRVPYALLRQGTAFQQLGDTTAARILYERLVDKYPNSPQAQAAEKKLKQMQ